MFKKRENVAEIEEGDLLSPKFDNDGLIPVITMCSKTKDILMMAWMNQEAIKTTLAEGRAVYWSRSRNELWRKGETSGHIQKLVEFRWDCDNDAILLLVDQTGVACHTGERSCFFNQYRADNT